MNKKFQLLAATIILGSILIVTQAQAVPNRADINITQTSKVALNIPPGPEADPYLRHHPNGYDFENELPPNDFLP